MLDLQPSLPRRIVCLTEETVETLYLLGADELIVGISGFTVRPKEARKNKPKISTYLDANIEQILALKPDVVLAWSDLQADICANLMRAGVEVIGFNHRSVQGILSMMLRLGALVGKQSEATRLVTKLQAGLQDAHLRGERRRKKPRVYFEEWYDPLISGICWVSEVIELCGGVDISARIRLFPEPSGRIFAPPEKTMRRKPNMIALSCWEKLYKPDRLTVREGGQKTPAVANGCLFEIPSPIILQPGPAALTEGVERLLKIFDEWEARHTQ